MNDNENILLRDSEPSITFNLGEVQDGQMVTPSTMVDNPPEERPNEASDNFDSLTYVSSQGFFSNEVEPFPARATSANANMFLIGLQSNRSQ